MKLDFQNLNLAPTPNPKPLKVVRISVTMEKSETAAPAKGESLIGYIRNACIHPATII